MNKFGHFSAFFAFSLLLSTVESQRVGYIGPACAVTVFSMFYYFFSSLHDTILNAFFQDDSLFLHGEFVRKMKAEEIQEFYRYQGALQMRKQLQEAVDKG